MLTKKTVLVLGAGASVPFSFPTGTELSQQLVGQLNDGGVAFSALKDFFEFSPEQIRDFKNAFYYSGKNSVDGFLEHRTDYTLIGKAAIAAVLIGYERPDKLFQFDASNWLRYLYNNLNTSFEEFGSNALSFVTFNYDRNIEHFFFTSLQNTYSKTNAECKALLEKIPIIHLHGRLGALPWQSGEGRDYKWKADKSDLTAAVKEIKIIHEDISDGRDKDFEKAKVLMREADQILMMGFGFNRMNIERLGIASLDRPVMSTYIGLGNREKNDIVKACGSQGDVP